MDVRKLIERLNDPAAIAQAAKEARYVMAVAEAKSRANINAMNLELRRYRPTELRKNY